MEKCLSSCPSYQLFVIFLPEKQRLSQAKNFNSRSVCDENKSPRPWDFSELSPGKQPPSLHVSDSFQFTDGDHLFM